MSMQAPLFRSMAGLVGLSLLFAVVSPCYAVDRVIVREGRAVLVRFTDKVEIKEEMDGTTIRAEIAEPLRTSGKVVLAEGAKVTFDIGTVENPGMLGKGGKAMIKSITALAADGSEIRLRPAPFTRKGGGKRFLAILLLPVVLLGLFIKGSPAKFEAGETIPLEVAADSEVLVD